MTGIPKKSALTMVRPKGPKNRKLKRSLGHYDQGKGREVKLLSPLSHKIVQECPSKLQIKGKGKETYSSLRAGLRSPLRELA